MDTAEKLNDCPGQPSGTHFSRRIDTGRIEVVDEAMAEILRKKTPAQRIAIGASLRHAARTLVKAHLRATHPEWDSKAITAELNRRFSDGTS